MLNNKLFLNQQWGKHRIQIYMEKQNGHNGASIGRSRITLLFTIEHNIHISITSHHVKNCFTYFEFNWNKFWI